MFLQRSVLFLHFLQEEKKNMNFKESETLTNQIYAFHILTKNRNLKNSELILKYLAFAIILVGLILTGSDRRGRHIRSTRRRNRINGPDPVPRESRVARTAEIIRQSITRRRRRKQELLSAQGRRPHQNLLQKKRDFVRGGMRLSRRDRRSRSRGRTWVILVIVLVCIPHSHSPSPCSVSETEFFFSSFCAFWAFGLCVNLLRLGLSQKEWAG